jgi:hypothetical protein
MNKHVLAVTTFLLCGSAGNAQYDTLWIGTADGPSTSLDNTPFPTEVARAARTQYLVQADDLVLAGLGPNTDVVGICFQVVDDDLTDPACLVDLHTEMKNDVTSSLTDFVYTGLLATGTTSQVNLSHGVLGLEFAAGSFWQWAGVGFNAVVEISYERSEEAGISPRILLDQNLGYTATSTGRTEQNIMGHDITSLYPADVELGSDNSLPAMGLLVEAFTSSLPEHAGAADPRLSPNPCGTWLNIAVSSGVRSLRITDMCGRPVLVQPLTSTTAKVNISNLPTGCYMVSTVSGEGVLASAKLIKE